MARKRQVRIIASRRLQRGGYCLLRGRPVVMIPSHLGIEEKLEVLRNGLDRIPPPPTGEPDGSEALVRASMPSGAAVKARGPEGCEARWPTQGGLSGSGGPD
jgi:hypothetical protein